MAIVSYNSLFILMFVIWGAGAMPVAAQAAPLRIVTFGDSTTASRGPLVVYADRMRTSLLCNEMGVEVTNAGVGGNTTADAKRRLTEDVLNKSPSLVVVQFGINDSAVDVWKTPPATTPRITLADYEANLRFFVKTIRMQGAQVVLMTPNSLRWTDRLREIYGKPPYDPNDVQGLNVLLAKYADVVRKVAAETQTPLVDVYSAFEMYESNSSSGQRVDDLLLDGMHPNDQGQRLVFELLVKQLQQMKFSEGDISVASPAS